MIDLHSHLLPGVDDGAANLAEARSALEIAYRDGVRGVVVTPHLNASDLFRPAAVARIRDTFEDAWLGLSELAARNLPDLRLYRGAELMLDHPGPDLSSQWVRLAGTRFVLMEFTGMQVPPRATEVLAAFVRSGYTPVIAHPERYGNASMTGADVRAWRDAGARVQVNSGSVLGYYGTAAAQRAQVLLESGCVDYLASDYHARGRLTLLECRNRLEADGCAEQAVLLLCTNPARLLEGEDPIDVAPLDRPERGWKERIRNGLFPGRGEA